MKPRVFLLVFAAIFTACGTLCLMGGEDEHRVLWSRSAKYDLKSFGHYLDLNNLGPAEKFGEMFLRSELSIRDMQAALDGCVYDQQQLEDLLKRAKEVPRLYDVALAMEQRIFEVRHPTFLALLADDLKTHWIIGVSSVLWLTSAALVYQFIRARRIDLRTMRGQCPGCGYDLTGGQHAKCPECGLACGSLMPGVESTT